MTFPPERGVLYPRGGCPLRLLVTGSGGHVGRTLIPALLADPRVRALVATDREPVAPSADPRMRFVRRDLVHEPADDLLEDVDVAIHLAFRVERRPGEDAARVNVEAAQRFLRAAAARLEGLVFASSVVAYGYPEAPGEPVTEEASAAPTRGFYYAEHKRAAEALLAELAARTRCRIVVARPCVVGGPSIPAGRARPYRGKLLWVPQTRWPIRYQVIHEADAATAFVRLVDAPAGTYNVAPDDAISLPEVATLLGQTPVVVPRWACRAIVGAAWRMGLGELDEDWVRTLDWPSQVMSNAKLRALGWTPRFGTREAILASARPAP